MLHDLLIPCAITLAFFLATLFGTKALRPILVKHKMFDTPDNRRIHKNPTPRGGGIVVIGLALLGMIGTAAINHSFPTHGYIILATLLLAGVSWMDDRKPLSPLLRFCVHLIAVILGTMSLPENAMLLAGAVPFWLDRLLLILGWAWFINLYNFMDGIDGITCTQTIFIATGVCLLFTAQGLHNPFMDSLSLILTGVCLGFLALNWYPAKIFLGDVGSVPLGFLAAYLLILLDLEGRIWASIIIPLYYIADSGIVIVKRAIRGERVWEPHLQSFFHQAVRGTKRHDTVVYWIIFANSLLIIAALCVAVNRPVAIAAAFIIVAILLRKMHKAGQKKRLFQ